MKKHFGAQTLVAAFVLALAMTAVAQEKPAGGPNEGIKVHGHWTIEIRNPDGSLASRSEFQNSLSGGQLALARLLGKLGTVDFWELTISTGQNTGPCGPAGQPSYCAFAAVPQVPLDSNGSPGGIVEIKGQVTATNDSLISLVGSGLYLQVGTGTALGISFSVRQLAPCSGVCDDPDEEKPVVAGQIVQVTVVFSFS